MKPPIVHFLSELANGEVIHESHEWSGWTIEQVQVWFLQRTISLGNSRIYSDTHKVVNTAVLSIEEQD